MWTIFKVFIEFATTLLLFFYFLAERLVRYSFLDQGSNPHPLYWKLKS